MGFGILPQFCPLSGYFGVNFGVIPGRLLVLLPHPLFLSHIFNAFLALPNVRGTHKVSKQSKMTTKWAKNMCFTPPLGPRTHPEKSQLGPLFTLFLVSKRLNFAAFGDIRAVKTAQIGLKTG